MRLLEFQYMNTLPLDKLTNKRFNLLLFYKDKDFLVIIGSKHSRMMKSCKKRKKTSFTFISLHRPVIQGFL